MAGMIINSGPVDASDFLRHVPQSKWFELMQVRRSFLRTHLSHDCRSLLQFVEDAEQMYAPLGFASSEDFIERGLELDSQDVAWALDGLRRLKPDEPIPYEKAKALGQREIGIEGGKPGPGRGHKTGDSVTRLKRGNTRTYSLARLHRDRPDLAARVEAGELSANAAAIEAGFRRKPTRFEQIMQWLPKLTADERALVHAETGAGPPAAPTQTATEGRHEH